MNKVVKLLSITSVLCLVVLFSPKAHAAANVNNFSIKDFQIDYYLSKDDQGNSTLKTVETIRALFPTYDQNHGLIRDIPDSYDNHSTHLHVNSVVDETGGSIPYSSYDYNDNLELKIGSANYYVHGLNSYVITYTQKNVTKFFSNTNDDEFYWDTNGTGWPVPIDSLSVRLHLDNKVTPLLTHQQSCYQGVSGSTETCDIIPTNDGFTASASNLNPNENMTLAVGFKAHSFAVYKMTQAEKFGLLWLLVFVATLPLAALIVIFLAVRCNRQTYRKKEMKTIIPQYLPPKDVSVSVAGTISRLQSSIFSAQLVDFAVRGYIKIYQTSEKALFHSANYELEIVKDIDDLKDEEKEILTDIFSTTTVGSRLDMSSLKNNNSIRRKLMDNPKKLKKDIAGAYGLKAKDDKKSGWFKKLSIVLFILSLATLSPWMLAAAITSLVLGITLRPLTDEGLELAIYLRGLEMYIQVAEEDRLRMLQSPKGALHIAAPIDTNNKRQLIKLYEKVLPYAVLFGQEKQWNKQLGQYYQAVNVTPIWFVGNGNTFDAAAFSTAISTFSQTSSSYGGAAGGGASGGGGGGGGGGGW